MRACCAPRGEGREGGVGFLLSPDARFNGSLASGHQGVSLARGHEGIKLQTFVISSFCVIVCVYDRPPKNNVCMPAVCIIGHKTRKQSLIGHKKTISHRPQENNLS